MKWLMVIFLMLPVMAFSKNFDTYHLSKMSVVPENELSQQRGGFTLPGLNYSIGLRMEALVNNRRVFFSNVFDIANNRLVLPAVNGLPAGMNITPLVDRGQIGYIIQNSASGVRTDVILNIDIVAPKTVDTFRTNQGAASRFHDAIQRQGY
ncbi:hypothetical protein [Zobellella iuensis]|uniref:Adhesin n=1 Tax=Zobellella iuensis TaxID=2803811 RepID=A0ABS1QTL9_9GAMM|nr:hypothetical protein [Zobellella iuensis]MBL1377463.1 hypothetical protein [Zobellella iuensis]